MAKKEELLDLAKRESDALLDAEIAAQERTAETDLDNKTEIDALSQSHRDMADAQAAYNQAQYQNMGQIIGDIQGKIDTAKKDDETATRRENAYRYISGLGDTLSSLANLVGTAHSAANQKQTYNSSRVVEKAEAARKARKLEMEELNKRLDEMKTKQRELKAAGSLEEAKMKFKHDKEMATLLADQRKAKLEADRYADTRADKAMADARDAWRFNITQQAAEDERTWRTDENAKDRAAREAMNNADNVARLAVEAAKQAAKNASDPKYKARKLNENITGIRDELAQAMGYTDYNEFLRYENVSGWGKEIEGQRDRVSKKIRKEKASKNPEVMEILNDLRDPDSLSEESIQRLMSASKVFADAVNAGDVVKRGDDGRIKVDY